MVPLVVAFTPNYFVPAATMLRSLLDSSEGDSWSGEDSSKFRVICLVTEDIPRRMQDKLLRMGDGRMEFEYINLGGRLKDVYTDPRYSEAASFRLLLPDLLPEYDSVVYIDCDVIVRQDIARLYAETDLGDNYLGVVCEAPIENQAERIIALGCDPDAYFNSGFLLMNLKKMREDGIVEKFLEASKVDWLEFPDQDVLNQVCKGRVLPLSPVYNSIRTFFLPQYMDDFNARYSPVLWYEVQDKGNIHYTGGKPWNLFTVKFGEWWRTYDSLPQEIKDEWIPDPKVMRIWKVYRNFVGEWCLDTARSVYRFFKH